MFKLISLQLIETGNKCTENLSGVLINRRKFCISNGIKLISPALMVPFDLGVPVFRKFEKAGDRRIE
jgi:hypothetical protein